jgi:hypothetical protein
MPRSLPRLRLRRLSQRQPPQRCQRRSSILKTMMRRTTKSALAGPAPPSPLLPHQPPHRLPHRLSPEPPHASVSILPLLPGAYAFAELAGVMEAASVRRVFTVRRGRYTYLAGVSPTSSGSNSKMGSLLGFSARAYSPSSLSRAKRGQVKTTFSLALALCYFFSFNEQ